MKIFTTAAGLLDENAIPVYDALNGVVIDWDGELHDEPAFETKNEIDVLLMHDIVPVFISCKNGIVTSDELYKLNTVAERFGGPFAKKILVTTAIDLIGESGLYIRQRAKDMNIRLIDNVQEINDNELAKTLKTLWCT